MVFQDIIGGTKIYTEQERLDIIEENFIDGIRLVLDKMGMDEEDLEYMRDWIHDQSPDILKMYRKSLTENELDTFMSFVKTPLAKKSLSIQVDVNSFLGPKLEKFFLGLEEMKIKERKKARMVRNMNEDYNDFKVVQH